MGFLRGKDGSGYEIVAAGDGARAGARMCHKDVLESWLRWGAHNGERVKGVWTSVEGITGGSECKG